jgi:hypothetical protein
VRGDNLSVYNVFVYGTQTPKTRTVTRMAGVVCCQ